MTETLPIIRPRHRTRTSMECGTPGGYQRHYRHGEEPCSPCKAASSADRRGLERGEYDAHLWELMVGRVDVTDMTAFGATHYAGLVMGA